MTPTDPTECLFCGLQGAELLSEEDVVPRWVLSHFKFASHDKTFQGVVDSKTGEIKVRKVRSTYAFLEPRVCEKDCNNGWMSRLEKKAAPLLKPLIDGVRAPSDLTDEERMVIAKWAAKTAYLHSYAGVLDEPVDRSHLQSLTGDYGQIPSGVGVFAMQADHFKPTSYVQFNQWPMCGWGFTSREPAPGSYKVGLQFGRLHLLTAYWPGPDRHLMPTPRHFPVWPIRRDPWPQYDGWMPPDSSVDPLYRFVGELAVLAAIRQF